MTVTVLDIALTVMTMILIKHIPTVYDLIPMYTHKYVLLLISK